MYCLCIHDELLKKVNKLGYEPVGLGQNNYQKGWVRDSTDENISSNSFIIEYKGEVIRPILSEVRQDRLYIDEPDYMFRIDNEVVIDATTRGSLARYINHSCDPNCYTKIISVDGEKKISIYSKKDIEKGEELHYDYKFPYEEDSSKKIKC